MSERGSINQLKKKPVESVSFPDEIAHLIKINDKLDSALKEAEEDVKQLDREYTDMKRYMSEYRGEIDPKEMFQNELALKAIDHTGVLSVGVYDKLMKLLDSPYFARIDFRQETEVEADSYYIGRFAFQYDHELLISDWRSPIAGMFYDCELGPAGYLAPRGRIEGELTRKRQFKIKSGVMEYALESSVNIQDDVLQKELSQTSDEKMKSIIATIQKEQNQIIRNEKANTLIIQGVAGSGKTSIALHRVAFLLYRFKESLSSQNVMILSPNKVFGDYISNVLPELGEEPIYEMSFTDIARVQLDGVIDFEGDKDPLEVDDVSWAKRVQYKSTLRFLNQLEEFAKEIPKRVFRPTDYSFGNFTVTAETIGERFHAYGRYSVKHRLQMVAEDICDRFETSNIRGEETPKSKTVLTALKKMLTVKSTLALYREFYKQNNLTKMFHMANNKTLEWADVWPFLYIHAFFEGIQEGAIIKHLVVDEMQDYTPVQYAVLNLLFKCPKTILGDFSQFVNPNHLHTLKDIQTLYGDGQFVKLLKSYRSTYEIISFARKIKETEALDAVERHGEVPETMAFTDGKSELKQIKKAIETFEKSENSSLGILTKTPGEAKQLYNLLAANYEVHLLSSESNQFENGVSITSVQMSKGLEFDEVIIVDVDEKNYCTEFDKNLLYIACTRAMHKLALFYVRKASLFIEFSVGKRVKTKAKEFQEESEITF